jgi:phenylalanine-4-hydroxylase
MAPLVREVRVISSGEHDSDHDANSVPWFPRKISDLDSFAEKVLDMSGDLDADHPGFSDATYRARRAEITALAKVYKHGDTLPRVSYTEKEIATWAVVFDKLTGLYKTHACKEHQYVFPLLVQNCGFRRGIELKG